MKLKLSDYSKAFTAGLAASYGTWQAVNHHGTWQNTLIWVLGSGLVTAFLTYAVPNTSGGEAAVTFPLSKVADLLERLGLHLPSANQPVVAAPPATAPDEKA